MKPFSFIRDKTTNLVLDILFLASGIGLFIFYKDMFYLHIIVISFMILMLIKSYYQGVRNGLIWLGLIISPQIFFMLRDGALTANELSEILLISGPSVTVGLLAERQRRYVKQLKEAYISTLKALAGATDAKDSYTQGHSERVAGYAVSIAKQMSLSENDINYLEQAALLHDIGKISIPDRILHKKDPLDENERLIMKKHPEYSQKILSRLDFLSPILPIVLHHHRRFDEQGHSLEGNQVNVHLIAGILAVSDAFDAMTSDRPYRDRLNPEQAFEELEKYSGTQFDPDVVNAFKKIKGFKIEREGG